MAMEVEKYNKKNTAVKRILQEVKEMQSNPSDDFMALPLEENILEWQFAILGPRDTEFEGGIYHGRIQLPAEYPFKPPAFMMLTPNGRFETQTKICLSISNYHPEHWQPSWSVRTALVALIAFMPTNPGGALGSLDCKKEERCALAIKSREAPPKYGSPERQKIIEEIHRYMLSKAPPVPAQLPSTTPEENSGTEDKESEDNSSSNATPVEDGPNPEVREEEVMEEVHEGHVEAAVGQLRVGLSLSRQPEAEAQVVERPKTSAKAQKPMDDRLLTWAAVALTVAIVVLLVKKFVKSHGLIGYFMDGS
ncbi:ubiquitin-conjugating enzyme E2 32 [Ananas comosus]|uniref:Ubiquitin-conjugating enzyme E2 32 n=1 Tax=Ananas comosus TaxID=4615 RepID=A0A6P5G3Z0_ANACO|nr:ubiquitin-conjugating enzyme E2 32 [Ananas comosus]